MIKVHVIYPNTPGSTFDMRYYLEKHMPMLGQRMGGALKGMTVDAGLTGGQPGTEASYRVITGLSFESLGAFEQAFLPHAEEIRGDVPRFTNITPQVQISEVKL